MTSKEKKKHIKENLKKHRWAINTWARLESELIYSYAFSTLSAITMLVLIRFLQKRPFHKDEKKYKGPRIYDNRNLVFTYSEAEAFGISPKSFARAIQDLVRKGFIHISHPGGSLRGRDFSRYDLINDWRDYGTSSFKPREKKSVINYSKSIKKHNEKRMNPVTGKVSGKKKKKEHEHTPNNIKTANNYNSILTKEDEEAYRRFNTIGTPLI